MSDIQFAFQLNYTPVNALSGATASGFFDFSPLLNNDSGLIFDTSDFNAIFNNYNLNRPNTFLQDVDYSTDAIIPVNIELIRNNTATKANTPDSNYTARRVTYPRYEGSRIQSANYNFYTNSGPVAPPSTTSTSSGVLDYFLNGDTGSWGGDESFGNTAVVEKNPIYIAHFNNSIENKGLEGTYTFNIDYLLEIPSTDIKGTDYKPKPIKISGDNDKLYEVVSTFEKNRDALVSYESFNIIGNELIDSYNALQSRPKRIYQGGHSLELNLGNTIDNQNYFPTCSFATASWGFLSYTPGINSDEIHEGDFYIQTGSDLLILSGSNVFFSSSYDGTVGSLQSITAPGLGLVHTINYAVKEQNKTLFESDTTNSGSIGIPRNTTINPNLKENYYRFKFTSSAADMTNFEIHDEPFLIEKGDFLSVNYSSSEDPAQYYNQVFEVTNVGHKSNTFQSNYAMYFQPVDDSADGVSNTIYDYISVIPDPSSLSTPIPGGKISNFILIKRRDKDKKVIIYQQPPNDTVDGAKTPSGPGYIIPNDMNLTQKNNVQAIINDIPQPPPNISNT